MVVDKLILLDFGSSIGHFQCEALVLKALKSFKWFLHIGSTNYFNILCGQPITVLVLRHFCWSVFVNKKLLFWLNFKALLTYHILINCYKLCLHSAFIQDLLINFTIATGPCSWSQNRTRCIWNQPQFQAIWYACV